jgi:FkbH-like protein/FkbM family methyltransferase
MNEPQNIVGQKERADVTVANAFTTHKLVSYKAAGSQAGTATFTVGIGLFPYLADHGFQGMVVLPGAFFVEMALCVHRECLGAAMGAVKRVEFLNPVILPEGNITLTTGVRWLDERTVQYTFRETTGPDAEAAPGPPSARLEIECGIPPQTAANVSAEPFSVAFGAVSTGPFPAAGIGERSAFNIEDFQDRADDLGEPADFYRRLRENGNQYGPQFQGLLHVWRSEREALGRLRAPPAVAGEGGYHLHPILLDSAAQLLSSIHLEKGRTFILQGFGKLRVLRPELPRDLWVHGRLRQDVGVSGAGWTGDLEVFDDSGAGCLRLQGVRFTHLDQVEPGEDAGAPKTDIVVAATFTAEPVEDSLLFWGDLLGLPVRVGFAPYNQVFQELLNPDSQLRRNRDGLNVILVNLADWTGDGRTGALKLDPEIAAAHFENLDRFTLPNGIEIAHLNRHESEYVYQEIFEDRVYLRHGIRLPDDATVIDIGANIGLFSLFVRSQAPRASVYAYEPSPVAFRALKANCGAYGPNLRAFNLGVSDRRGSAQLTFYERSSVFSSFHSNVDEDRQAIQAVVANMVRGELGESAESAEEYVEELMTDRLKRQTFECQLVSVSDIMTDNALGRVNLLKVDAEKCELEILRGIDDRHWPLIDQVVVEVHDRSRRAVGEVQEILTKQGFRCSVEEENLLTGSGLFNVYATRGESGGPVGTAPGADEAVGREVRLKVDEFVQALDSFARAAGTPVVLCLCPPGRSKLPTADFGRELAEIERSLLQRVRELPQIQAIGSEEILARYPVADFHDPHADHLGHIPYTPEGFAAVGSSVFRTIAGLRRPPYKVIVLDCDNTLWQGACGEEGPLGVTVTPAHRALQEFMVRQMGAGMLLCLGSKNSEADVWAVFDRNPGMVLKREHLAGWRINWAAKSDNLRALAGELNVGLESVIFVDDNPVECAEVRANAPAALVLQLPPDPSGLPQFLRHIWAFDHLRLTEEDLTRTRKVRENVQREKYREQVSTLADFIDGLQLQVEILEPGPELVGRISQLTLRTNQFNFTTVRRSENDIIRYLEIEHGRGLAVKVRDRFGDYGLVGILLYQADGEGLHVDTFLLSCRVLGRGVEHRILAELGRRAVEQGKAWVDVVFRSTGKNQPAADFINSVAADLRRGTYDGAAFRFPSARLAGLRYDPAQARSARPPTGEDSPVSAGPKKDSGSAASPTNLSEKFQRIARKLNTIPQISAAIEARRMSADGTGGSAASGELPATLEGRLLGIWRKTLGNPRIGVQDNFFEAGGTSLKAVQTVATIRRELHVALSIVNIFECPTVRLLAQKLEPGAAPPGAVSTAGEAMERGARRKQRVRKRG